MISAADAINYSLSGPSLRGSGVAYDVRAADPYSIYDRFDWQVVTREIGDSLSRFLVRVDEIKQSLSIVEQALEAVPEGELKCRTLPRMKLPEGQIYYHIESARGDLGVYIVSDGGEMR